MLAEYTGVLVIFAISLVLVAILLGIHLRVGPRREFPSKQEPSVKLINENPCLESRRVRTQPFKVTSLPTGVVPASRSRTLSSVIITFLRVYP